MPAASFTNPNVCPGCVQLLDDDSPLTMALNASTPNDLAAPARGDQTEHALQTFHDTPHVLH